MTSSSLGRRNVCSITFAGIILSIGCEAARSSDAVADTEVGADTQAAGPMMTPSADGIPLAYEVRGSDAGNHPTLIFVHGWSCDRTYWDAQVGPLSERYQVVTLDLAGHGESGLGREKWTIASYGSDVDSLVKKLGLDRVILIGHSMGGDVVVDAARKLGNRVDGLVWVDTYRQLGAVRTPEQVEEFLAPLEADFSEGTDTFVRENMFPPDTDPRLVERVARDMSEAPPEVALPSLESSITNDRIVPIVLKEELDVPVVAINPDDGSTDVESLEQHGVEVVLMADVGHFMMMEAPERFNDILMAVIEDLELAAHDAEDEG